MANVGYIARAELGRTMEQDLVAKLTKILKVGDSFLDVHGVRSRERHSLINNFAQGRAALECRRCVSDETCSSTALFWKYWCWGFHVKVSG